MLRNRFRPWCDCEICTGRREKFMTIHTESIMSLPVPRGVGRVEYPHSSGTVGFLVITRWDMKLKLKGWSFRLETMDPADAYRESWVSIDLENVPSFLPADQGPGGCPFVPLPDPPPARSAGGGCPFIP